MNKITAPETCKIGSNINSTFIQICIQLSQFFIYYNQKTEYIITYKFAKYSFHECRNILQIMNFVY